MTIKRFATGEEYAKIGRRISENDWEFPKRKPEMRNGMGRQYRVKKIEQPIDWTVEVPGSKSMTNRALLMAALTEGTVELRGVLFSDDSRYFLSSLQSLGFHVLIREAEKKVTVTGCGGEIPLKEAEIYVGSAGTAARFLTAMLGFSDGCYTVTASEQMKKRPMKPLFDLLIQAGAKIKCLEEEGHLPIRIEGCRKDADTETKPLTLELDISKSTQFLSAMLLVAPMIKQGLLIHITSEKTDGSYIRITREMLKEAGTFVEFDGRDYRVLPDSSYQKRSYQIEPDMSAACYFYAAAAVTGGRALIKGVHSDNSQGDLKFLKVLEQMGCTVAEETDGIAVTGPENGALKGISVNMNDFSDQALTLAAIAPYAAGPVRMEGIAHIRGQECDRIHAIAADLGACGILCKEEASAVTIYPGKPKPAVIDTYEDHRVAMAFSLLGLRSDGIIIDNPDCCKKTFEEYFLLLDELTGQNGFTQL